MRVRDAARSAAARSHPGCRAGRGADGSQQQTPAGVDQRSTALAPDHALGGVTAALLGDPDAIHSGRLRVHHGGVGEALRPARSRSDVASACAMRSKAPLRARQRKQRWTVCLGGSPAAGAAGAARPQHVEHAVRQGVHRPAAWPATGRRAGQERLRDPPHRGSSRSAAAWHGNMRRATATAAPRSPRWAAIRASLAREVVRPHPAFPVG